jgi:hypothetical protein
MRSTLRAAWTKSRARRSRLFVQLRHFLDRQPFRKCDSPRVDVAAHQHIDDLERSHRAIEPYSPALRLRPCPSTRARRGKARVAHDLCVCEAASNRSACCPLPDHDELLWSAYPVRLVNTVPPKPAGKRRRTTGEHNHEGNQREDLTHGHQDNPAG